MTNAEQFLDHYSAIEQYLRRTYGSKNIHDTFLQLITKAEIHHSVIAYYANDLREYGELRNAIVHKYAPQENSIIAEPHSFVVERMAHIRKMIEDPLKIKDVMVKSIKIANVEDSIYDVAINMYKNIYTHVPVYEEGKFIGVLSESSLLRWTGYQAKRGVALNTTNKILRMKKFLDVAGNKFNDFEFVPNNTLILDVRDKFEKALYEGRRLGVVFATKTGKNSEYIEGLLTAWDLPKLRLK